MRIAFSVKLCDGFQGENKICLRGKIENCMCPMGHREVEKSTKNQKIIIKILLFEYIGPKLYFIHSWGGRGALSHDTPGEWLVCSFHFSAPQVHSQTEQALPPEIWEGVERCCVHRSEPAGRRRGRECSDRPSLITPSEVCQKQNIQRLIFEAIDQWDS